LEITSVLRAADVKNIPHIPAFPTQPNRRALLPAAGTNHHNHAHSSAARISRGEGLARMPQAEYNTTYTGPSGGGAYAVVANAQYICNDWYKMRSWK
jgi:hypothetical protein